MGILLIKCLKTRPLLACYSLPSRAIASAQFVGLAPNTQHFSTAPNTYGDESVPSTRTQCGIIIGFVTVGIFFLYVVVRIIRDEFVRAALWNSRVAREEHRLKENWPHLYTQKDIDELSQKFDAKELVGDELPALKKDWLKNQTTQ